MRRLAWLMLLLLLAGCAVPDKASPVVSEGVTVGGDVGFGQPHPVTEPDPPVPLGTDPQGVMADLNGDGRPEVLRGLFDRWTTAKLEVLDADGQLVEGLTPGWEHKITPVHLLSPEVTVLLEWQRRPDGITWVGVRFLRLRDGAWNWQTLYGWGLKHAQFTRATRANLTPDGTLDVEWEMDDPAGHTRVRQYRLDLHQERVEMITESLRPTADQLLDPNGPEAVLQAAYVAAIHGLEEELSLYFNSELALERFQETVGRPPYELTSIQLARTEVLDQSCNARIEPTQPSPDGTAPFVIEIAGIPAPGLTIGTVRFDQEESGRWVIQEFAMAERCP